MTNNKTSTSNSGFTIVEVLFVLAIAGIMLYLVFQAIPSLQRGSRNNQRKQDVLTSLRAVSQYELSNSGNFPPDCGGAKPACTNSGNFLQYDSKKFTNYDPTDPTKVILIPQCVVVVPSCTPRIDRNPLINDSEIDIYNYEKCDTSTLGKAVIAAAGYNDVVAQYALESGNGPPTPQCVQL